MSTRTLAPGGVEGNYNLYLQDNAARTYQLIFTSVGPPGFLNGEGTFGGDGSFDHVFVLESAALTPDAIDNQLSKIYEFSNGTLSLVSVFPNGVPYDKGSRMLGIPTDT